MRPSVRLLCLDLSSRQTLRLSYVCSTCRNEIRPTARLTHQNRRHASSDSITEKVRRKLWGTDNPPGLKDPYGGPGIIEQSFGRRREPEASEETQSLEELEHQPDSFPEYVPAQTIRDLEPVGYLGKWSEFPPHDADKYTPWVSKKKLTRKEHLQIAAHQAAVEVAILSALKQPLTSACNVHEHDKSIFKMIWKCKFSPNGNGQWDAALIFPDSDAESALRFVFEQIGSQAEASGRVAEEPVAQTQREASETEDVKEDPSGQEVVEAVPQNNNPLFFGYNNVQDASSFKLSFNDPAVKFAFSKRFSQLTGHYVPDHAVNSAKTVKDVLKTIERIAQPKPQKLAQYLATNPTLHRLPNVKIFTKRQSKIDMDEEVGRKKVIDEEFRARGYVA